MPILYNSLLLLALFLLLGIVADIVVREIKYVATVLKIRLFAFGILLGVITTLPELSVGINATLDSAGGLSAGNLLGGVVVILGLVLGASLILHRRIASESELKIVIPQVAIIFLPILLGLNGRYGLGDGLLMIAAYLGLIYYLYRANRSLTTDGLVLIEKNKIIKAIFFSVAGIIFILLLSHWIVVVALHVLQSWHISKLLMGTLIFAIGTNLPEISIAFTAWRKKTSELSLSHLLSSAFSNVLILGVLATIHPISIIIGPAYYILGISIAVILILFLIFYRSHRQMSRGEGFVLLVGYLIFLAINILIIK